MNIFNIQREKIRRREEERDRQDMLRQRDSLNTEIRTKIELFVTRHSATLTRICEITNLVSETYNLTTLHSLETEYEALCSNSDINQYYVDITPPPSWASNVKDEHYKHFGMQNQHYSNTMMIDRYGWSSEHVKLNIGASIIRFPTFLDYFGFPPLNEIIIKKIN